MTASAATPAHGDLPPADGSPAHGRPRVLVVSCGGTIASTRLSTDLPVAPRLDAARLVGTVPGLERLAELETETFSIVPSGHETLDDVIRLETAVRRRVVDGGVDGVVVTHGTDTLAEVAYALDLLWPLRVPLVLTGAMRNPALPGADGPANLAAAVATASSPAAADIGVLVVLNDEIHAARYVQKRHTSRVDAFASSTVGPLGYFAEGVPRIAFRPRRAAPIQLREDARRPDEVPVALVTVALGDDGRLLDAIGPSGYQGLVIEALGGGHVPTPLAESPTLGKLVAAMPVVLASRTGAGETLRRTYDFVGSESDLIRRGLIPAGHLDGPKARILLMLLLAARATPATIRHEVDLAGSTALR